MSNPKEHDASVRETVIAAIREYRRSLKRLMRVQHRALKPIRRNHAYPLDTHNY
jgi:hypothetical protein